jgi:hypothetical protein
MGCTTGRFLVRRDSLGNRVTKRRSSNASVRKRGSKRGAGGRRSAPKGSKKVQSRGKGSTRARTARSTGRSPKQARGSNTRGQRAQRGHSPQRAHTERAAQERKEPEEEDQQSRDKAPRQKERARHPADQKKDRAAKGGRSKTEEKVMYGPEKIHDFRKGSDDMVVGERTVVHHAAKYGIVRGATWAVILSALLFWLPVLGPATAGYVGGRKAGGPFRGLIAIAIPAIVLVFALAAVNEGLGLVPFQVPDPESIDVRGAAGTQLGEIPLIGSIQQSLGLWVSAPPDAFLIMAAFALVGGALSALRRREEETVIEKVGIPLGELKERIRKEEATRDGKVPSEGSQDWSDHPVVTAPIAAHDALNEMVEVVVARVLESLDSNELLADIMEGRSSGRRGPATRARRKRAITYDDLQPIQGTYSGTPGAKTKARRSGRSRAGGRAQTAAVARARWEPTEDEEWVVADTIVGRKPIRVVRSPPELSAEESAEALSGVDMQVEAMPPTRGRVSAEVLYEGDPPPLKPRHRRRSILPFNRRARRAELQMETAVPLTVIEEVAQPEVVEPVPSEPVAPAAAPNFERLPIISSIIEPPMEPRPETQRAKGKVRIKAHVPPTMEEAIEATTIAEKAANELAEMARLEEGPDVEPELVEEAIIEEIEEEFELPTEELPKPKPKAKKARSASKSIKHPTGALKSRAKRSRAAREEEKYDEDLSVTGTAVWEREESIEEEDLFNPRRIEDEESGVEDDGTGDAIDYEEERIASIVREREEWDRL